MDLKRVKDGKRGIWLYLRDSGTLHSCEGFAESTFILTLLSKLTFNRTVSFLLARSFSHYCATLVEYCTTCKELGSLQGLRVQHPDIHGSA